MAPGAICGMICRCSRERTLTAMPLSGGCPPGGGSSRGTGKALTEAGALPVPGSQYARPACAQKLESESLAELPRRPARRDRMFLTRTSDASKQRNCLQPRGAEARLRVGEPPGPGRWS
jgi:hypothetical protein